MKLVGLWAPVALCMALLFLASEQNDPSGGLKLPDKLLHAMAYAMLGVVSLRACHGGFRPLRVAPTLIAMGLTLGYGLIDEFHQAFVPGRDPSGADWVADAVGAGISVMLVGVFSALRARRG